MTMYSIGKKPNVSTSKTRCRPTRRTHTINRHREPKLDHANGEEKSRKTQRLEGGLNDVPDGNKPIARMT